MVRKPIVLSALFCAVLFYSGLVPVRDVSGYRSLLPLESARVLSGSVASNPGRLSSGGYYEASFSLGSAGGCLGKLPVTASALGTLKVSIPAAIVESLYPGRLYAQGVLVEQGEELELYGSWNAKRGLFTVKRVAYKGYGRSLLGRLRHCRAICRLVFKRLLFSWGSAGGLLLALLSGSREYTAVADGEAFRRAGLSHILALSGMHLSFFAGVTGRAGGALWGRRSKLWARLLGMGLFVWFAGFSPSLFRAFLTCLLMTVLELFHCRDVEMLPVLAAVFLLHILLLPADMFSASFMLSYGAMAGILCFAPFCEKLLVRALPPALAASLSASVGAQLATAPVALALFGTLMPVGIVATAAVSPLAGLFLAAGGVCIALCLALPFFAPLCGGVLNGIYAVLLFLVRGFARAPVISINKEFL